MAPTPEKEWIDGIKQPYYRVVGRNNQPPLPLKTVAQTQAGSRQALLDLYNEVQDKQDCFNEPPEDVSKELARGLYDPHPHESDQVLSDPVQEEKWFEYPKLRILAALKKQHGEIPSEEVIEDDWYGEVPEEEVALILLFDEYAQLDSQSPAALARKLRQNEELATFIENTYVENRSLRDDIDNLDRPGVTYALREAYETRIETLNDVYHTVIETDGPDLLKDRLEAEQEIRETREDLEQEVAEAFHEQVVPHLEAIEEQFDAMAAEAEGPAAEEIEPVLEEELWDLREDLQEWSITEAGDLDARIQELKEVQTEFEQTLTDGEFAMTDRLTDIANELDKMNTELDEVAALASDELREIEDELEAIAEEIASGEESTDDEIIEELARLLLLQLRVAEARDKDGAGSDG